VDLASKGALKVDLTKLGQQQIPFAGVVSTTLVKGSFQVGRAFGVPFFLSAGELGNVSSECCVPAWSAKFTAKVGNRKEPPPLKLLFNTLTYAWSEEGGCLKRSDAACGENFTFTLHQPVLVTNPDAKASGCVDMTWCGTDSRAYFTCAPNSLISSIGLGAMLAASGFKRQARDIDASASKASGALPTKHLTR